MDTPTLEQVTHRGVSYLTAPTLSGSVRFGFTERTGGVSQGAFRSLNLGERCGDAQTAVTENRRRALAALGAEDCSHAWSIRSRCMARGSWWSIQLSLNNSVR